MTGDKITYGESIECPGRWRRMDYETTVREGETEQSAGNRAQLFVQNFLSQNNPHLYQEQSQYVKTPPDFEEKTGISQIWTNNPQIFEKPSQTIENQPKKLSQKELITQEIERCTTIKQIDEWQLLAQKYPDLKELWYIKYDEIANQPAQKQP